MNTITERIIGNHAQDV